MISGAPRMRSSSDHLINAGPVKDRAGVLNQPLARYFDMPDKVMRNGQWICIAEHNSAIWADKARKKRRR